MRGCVCLSLPPAAPLRPPHKHRRATCLLRSLRPLHTSSPLARSFPHLFIQKTLQSETLPGRALCRGRGGGWWVSPEVLPCEGPRDAQWSKGMSRQQSRTQAGKGMGRGEGERLCASDRVQRRPERGAGCSQGESCEYLGWNILEEERGGAQALRWATLAALDPCVPRS